VVQVELAELRAIGLLQSSLVDVDMGWLGFEFLLGDVFGGYKSQMAR